MKDILPEITIKTDTSPNEFVDRFHKIVLTDPEYEVEFHGTSRQMKEWYCLVFRPVHELLHHEMICELIARNDLSDRVTVGVRAKRWHPQEPDYDMYTRKAIGLFAPLLKSYNKNYKSRRRLRIPSKSSLEPRLPKDAKRLFDRFVLTSNKTVLSSTDWDKFYVFVRHCGQHNVKLYNEDIERLLIRAGFDEDYAHYIADIYGHGICICRVVPPTSHPLLEKRYAEREARKKRSN